MGLFSRIGEYFGFGSNKLLDDSVTGMGANNLTDLNNPINDFTINPATGLPMIDGMGGVDIAGNPYGVDNNNHDTFGSSFNIGSNDSFGSSFDSSSSFGGGFGSDW